MRTVALLLMVLCAPQDKKTGAIKGHVSPEGSIKLILKKEQTDPKQPGNVKGEVLLPKGGDFTIENVPPGRYDLLFELQGEEQKKWIAGYWGDLVVEAGKTIEGINYRLTPSDAPFMVDEVVVALKAGATEAELRKSVEAARCRIKKRPAKPGKGAPYVVDIPDETSVDAMIPILKALPCVEYAEKNGIKRIPE